MKFVKEFVDNLFFNKNEFQGIMINFVVIKQF